MRFCPFYLCNVCLCYVGLLVYLLKELFFNMSGNIFPKDIQMPWILDSLDP